MENNSKESTPELPKPESPKPKLKIYQLIQKNFAAAGIDLNLLTQPYPLNRKILLNFLILTTSFICNLMHTFYEAKSFGEHVQSNYMCTLTISIALALVIVLLQVAELFSFIDNCENIVNKCKSMNAKLIHASNLKQ